ncbi:MAG: glycoside hydrolase family 130 protein [Deltaproteobacteria bacterium]|nr:glycoside hydrolase family 130 protein [Deltaproteobacteria bacterium]MBN2672573.1 glycoside hydrolase family 130 protein [Deltaproteobacteria bacterium]
MHKYHGNPIITPDMIPPSDKRLMVKGALNPGAVQLGKETLLLLRVAEGCIQTPGTVSIPTYEFTSSQPSLRVLHLSRSDPRVQIKDSRAVLVGDKEYVSTISHLRLARSSNGIDFKIDAKPFWMPVNPSEEFGVEDARITKIDDTYFINYTAVSGDSYGTSLLRTTDFKNVEYLGMIFSAPNKDVCIFPEKISGSYVALHRPFNHGFGKSSIWIAKSPDLIHWGQHQCLLRPGATLWESEKIGGGAPPIKTERGWLVIYHGKSLQGRADYYCLMVMLLDINDPSKIIYQGEQPILFPSASYETKGFVPNVVFLNGVVQTSDDSLLLYYSACDEVTCLAQCTIDDLIPQS